MHSVDSKGKIYNLPRENCGLSTQDWISSNKWKNSEALSVISENKKSLSKHAYF